MNLKVSILCLFLTVLLILPAGVALAAEDAIAVVIAAEGSSYVRRDGRDIALELKDRLLVSDTILTGADGKLQLLFNDNSAITLGPDSLLELREFADAGTQSKFDAHLEQGALRIITGWLTEANPAGFKMTTPLGTIGIRGTILNIETDDRRTTVRVLNTNKIVLVNGINVAENFKIVLARGQEPIVSKIDPGEREKADSEFFIRSRGGGLKGIKSAPLEGVTVDLPEAGNLMNDLNEHPLNIPISTNAGIAGSLGMEPSNTDLNSFSGSFSFNLDLQTGQVTNAAMSGSGTGTGTGTGLTSVNFNFTGGSGTLIAGDNYYIGGFTAGTLSATYAAGSGYSDFSTTNPAEFVNSNLNIDAGASNFANVGDATGANSSFRINYTLPAQPPQNIYDGTADGKRVW